jgi:diguanylate cyclase (GGDEF)-like protein
MSFWRSPLGGGFETRVASRTFLLFALCVAAPIALFSLVGYRMVTAELHEHASESLRSAAKSYGLLIFSRLQTARTLTQSIAERHLADDAPADALPGTVLGPVTIVRVENNPGPALRFEPERSVVELSAAVAGRGRALTVVARIDPAFLWDHDAVAMPFEALCVFDQAGRRLHCTNAGQAHEQWAQQDLIASDWSLFLRQSFGADDWTVRAYEFAGRGGHSTLRAFGTLLSAGAALAIIGGLLLSAIQIRRSHRPLLALTEAARRIGRMRFRPKVSIDSRDEYARLGRTFNAMGSRLQEQFSLLSTLARVDRRILSRESGTSILNVLLPKLPRMLGCNVAGILLLDAQGSGQLSLAGRRARGRRALGPIVHRDYLVRLLGGRSATKLDKSRGDAVVLQMLHAIEMSEALLAAVKVDGELHGVLLVAYSNARPWRHASRNAIGVAQRIAVAIRNEERERTLLQQAYYDALTGLPNRALFRDRLHRELTQSQERGTGGALLFIDIDGFKHVNDSLGHSVGDELLASLGRRIAGCCRPADTLARLGGDEFAIIVPEASVAECLRLTESIFEALRMPLQLHEIKYVAAASVGIAMYPQDGAGVEALLRNADLAMYRAKTNSRGHVQFFKEEMNREATRRLEIEHSLRAALLENGLTVHFQPIVHAQNATVVGAEALVRWFAGGAAVPPAQFIPIAEDTGLITRLGDWVMNEACRSLRAWRDAGIQLSYIAVNVSMRQLMDPGFVGSVVDALRRHGLDGGSLEIEVTESILAKNAETAGETLSRLREHGVRVAMDDFGTGYSSMAMLGTLPIDVVKIDRSFVKDCAQNAQARALAQALIGVGHALNKEVVVEGVESDAQRRALEQMGCERMQGYLFAQPMPRESFEEYMTGGGMFPAARSRTRLRTG